MTTQGERDPRPAGHPHTAAPAAAPNAAPTAAHRARRRPRRVLAGCAIAVLAVGVGWVVKSPHPGDWMPGLGPSSTHPVDTAPVIGATPAQPATEAQGFTADRYFPALRAVDQDDFKGRRTVGKQGPDCAETLRDRAHDILKQTGCQGYVEVGFTRSDNQLLASVTVFRFADAATAEKAKRAVDPSALVFLTADPAAAAPNPHALAGTRIETVGHYLTVTVLHFADQRTTDPDLDAATRAVSYVAGAPFAWM
ncbi:hypothetical protein [Kitasatospora sp. McL0602]|uniref:hypothetical protein n=1 Tax=Kitasatospora sp. McL0602 TaxID=3439530 RepID=UPI003F892AE6